MQNLEIHAGLQRSDLKPQERSDTYLFPILNCLPAKTRANIQQYVAKEMHSYQ
jgi:hypothetical protein